MAKFLKMKSNSIKLIHTGNVTLAKSLFVGGVRTENDFEFLMAAVRSKTILLK